jgi:hypothetical protein
MKKPLYRIEREAHEAEIWQWIKNVVRRVFFLPITKTSKQAKREVLDSYDQDLDFYDNHYEH